MTHKTYIELENVLEYPELIYVEYSVDADGFVELEKAHINLWGCEIDLLTNTREPILKGLKQACMGHYLKNGLK